MFFILNKGKVLSSRNSAAVILLTAITTIYFLTSAAQVLAATETIFGPAAYRVQAHTPVTLGQYDASAYSAVTLSFDFDSTTLDQQTPQDSFSYGYKSDGSEYMLGTILGLTGSTAAEIGFVSVDIPATALTNDLEITFSVVANSTSTSDKVELKNVIITGILKPVTVDLCPNIEAVQEVLPDGYEKNISGDCVLIPPPVVDMCPNIGEVQINIPSGFELRDGQCVEIVVVPTPTPTPTPVPVPAPENPPTKPPHYENNKTFKQCPRGFAKWIDRFSETNVWRADDVYKAVILFGGPTQKHLNRDKAHMLYIAGPTEVGDKYYRRHHKISLICVKG